MQAMKTCDKFAFVFLFHSLLQTTLLHVKSIKLFWSCVCDRVVWINIALKRRGESLSAANWDRWREMDYGVWWQDKTAERRGEIKGWWENERWWWRQQRRRRSEVKWKWVCLWCFKFWSGKSLHLLLWDGSDSVISMIGLNPGRVEETEWRA